MKFAPSPAGQASTIFIIGLLLAAAFWAAPVRGQGALTNGWAHVGVIAPGGETDTWTFTANIGDRILLRVGEITQTNTFTPRIRLMNPVGAQQVTASGALAAEVAVTATNSGTFNVLIDGVAANATGTYRLRLVRSPGLVTVAPGDEGGTLRSGFQHAGSIGVGDMDVWTFTAGAGDGIVLRMGTSGFSPLVRLYGPNGLLVAQAFDGSFGVRDADLRTQATNTGPFTVVVSSLDVNASGTYILTLAHVPEAITVSPGDQGGPLTNGFQHTAFLETGDLDVWSFSANRGDSIVLRMGSVGYNPWIRLFGPDGVLVGQAADGSFGVRDVEFRAQATNSGTFTVVTGSSSQNGTGAYILTLAHVPEAITISPGDQGGPMTNAFQHTGFLEVGDLDVWRFSASAGDAITLRMGTTNAFNPWIRLFGPDGVMVKEAYDGSFGIRDADLGTRATNSGIFTVVVGSLSQNGTGQYILTLAHVPEAITVSPGDQGGPLTNGFQHTAFLETGDLDVWSFSANRGDSIVLRMGSVGYNPWIRLFGPDGVLVGQAADNSFGVRDADLRVQATNSGTFTVVASSWSQNGTGAYILTLAHVPEAITVSPGDQGGPMANGFLHTGFLEVGDLDVWSFSANAGDAIALRMGTTNAYNPWIRLFAPNGALVAQGFDGSFGIRDAEMRIQAAASGTFTVVVGSLSQNGTGYYVLTLGRSPGSVVVAPGDQGGTMTNEVDYIGTIDVGDMDVWRIPACRASQLTFICEELTGGSAFTPRLRLFGPSGILLVTAFNATTAVLTHRTTNSGSFTLIVDGGGLNHTGSYHLSGIGMAEDGLALCSPLVTGTKLDVTGIGGVAGAEGVLFTHTNVVAPFSLWAPVFTNHFNELGVLTYTNLFDRTEPKRFFILQQR